MKERFIITQKTLLSVENSTLFYPCAGNDFFVPIHVFSPFFTEFWFVDRGYFSPGHQDTKYYGLDAPADQQPPLLQRHPDYGLIDTDIIGPPTWNWHIGDIEPCILTETYLHLPSSRLIRIHRRRGYGISAFKKEIGSLGVFFYRGDSEGEGEGGSGNFWLYSKRIQDICEKLIDGGLIVTDGSQHSERKDNIYKDL